MDSFKQKFVEAQNEIIEKTVTISKMSDEIENLLQSSAMVNAKMNIIENDLLEEKQNNEKFRQEMESLRNELLEAERNKKDSKDVEKRMSKQIEDLIRELDKRPTVELFDNVKRRCKEMEIITSKLPSTAVVSDQNLPLSIEEFDEEKRKIHELEEELVLMKERFAKCNDDNILLNKQYDKLQKEYHDLSNRSYNVMFFYIAPLVFLIAYLLFAVLFS